MTETHYMGYPAKLSGRLKHSLLHMRCHAKVGRPTSNSMDAVGINTKNHNAHTH